MDQQPLSTSQILIQKTQSQSSHTRLRIADQARWRTRTKTLRTYLQRRTTSIREKQSRRLDRWSKRTTKMMSTRWRMCTNPLISPTTPNWCSWIRTTKPRRRRSSRAYSRTRRSSCNSSRRSTLPIRWMQRRQSSSSCSILKITGAVLL